MSSPPKRVKSGNGRHCMSPFCPDIHGITREQAQELIRVAVRELERLRQRLERNLRSGTRGQLYRVINLLARINIDGSEDLLALLFEQLAAELRDVGFCLLCSKFTHFCNCRYSHNRPP